jgi:hypothetical protein
MPKRLKKAVINLILGELEKYEKGAYAFQLQKNCSKSIKRSTFYWYLHKMAETGTIVLIPVGGSEKTRPHTLLVLSKSSK